MMKKERVKHPTARGYDDSTITWRKLYSLYVQLLDKDQCFSSEGEFYAKVFPDSLKSVFIVRQHLNKYGKEYYRMESSASRAIRAIEDASGPFENARNALICAENQAGEVDPLRDLREKWDALLKGLTSERRERFWAELDQLLAVLTLRMKDYQPGMEVAISQVNTLDEGFPQLQSRLAELRDILEDHLSDVAVMYNRLCEFRKQLNTTNEHKMHVLVALSLIASTLFSTTDGYVWYEMPVIIFPNCETLQNVQNAVETVKNALRKRDDTDEAKKLREMVFPESAVSSHMKQLRDILASRELYFSADWEKVDRLLFLPLRDPQTRAEALFIQSRFLDMRGGESFAALKESAEAEWPNAQKEYGKRLFQKAMVDISNTQTHSAILKLDTIRKLQFCDPLTKADAIYELYVLITLEKDAKKRSQYLSLYDTAALLKQSMELGSKRAGQKWKALAKSQARFAQVYGVSSTESVCWFSNSDTGQAIQVFKNSLIQNKQLSPIPVDISAIAPKDGRYLFISDDQQKNLHDALAFLQLLQDKASTEWQGQLPRLYIRNDSEIAAAAVDTAMSHLMVCCDVRIINDAKCAAQQLLGRHPLFYPLPWNEFDMQKPNLNFVIIGTSDVAEWLCREAFWMTGFRNNSVSGRITIVAPEANTFVTRIKTQNPGMASNKISIEGIGLADIRAEKTTFEQADFMYTINKLREEPNTYLYFAVVTGTDEENLALARWLRVSLIRNAIKNGRELDRNAKVPIATYCRDTQLNLIARNMVLEGDEYGNAWFNNWALIPFGSLADTYSCNCIDDEILETMSKCIHLEYSGVDPALTGDELQKAVEYSLDSYYRHQYNRDSSYSIALGMPYRLFQFKREAVSTMLKWLLDQQMIQIQDEHSRLKVANYDKEYSSLIPQGWDILDSSAWASQAFWQKIGDRFPQGIPSMLELVLWRIPLLYSKQEDKMDTEEMDSSELHKAYRDLAPEPKLWLEELIAVSEWEHARWTRWMLSRGWMPATVKEAVFAYRSGNTRQQLFVARLHPCICSFADLLTLAKELREEAKYEKEPLDKDFVKYDVRNVFNTKQIMQLQWFTSMSE